MYKTVFYVLQKKTEPCMRTMQYNAGGDVVGQQQRRHASSRTL